MIDLHRPCLEDMTKDAPLNAAEEHLVEMCKTGEVAVFGDAVPSEGTPQNTIRAALIRHILLGGCDDVLVGPKGVLVQGAWITDVLDLEGCDSPLDLFLASCHICEQPILLDARLGAVMLPGCTVPGLNAHRLKVVRDVFLNHNFRSIGKVNLSGAKVGGALACDDGTFDGAGGVALDCNAMTVGASIFLRDEFVATGPVSFLRAQVVGQLACTGGTFDGVGGEALICEAMTVGADVFLCDGFVATGQVNLCGAQITGQLACDGGRFDGAGAVALNCDAMTVGASAFLRGGFVAKGEVNLVRAQIDGNLRCSKAEFQGVLDCEGITVGGGMYWQDVATPPKVFDLTDAHVGTLRDDVDSWQGCTPVLNGFRYDRIISEISLRERLAWLQSAKTQMVERGPRGRWYVPKPVPDVDAQPYTQFARVLDGQGHRRDAAAVRFEREKRVRKAQNAKWLVETSSPKAVVFLTLLARVRQFIDWCFGWMFGYGHQPARAILLVAAIWAFCWGLYGAAYNAGQMAPNSDVVLTSYEWMAAAEAGCSDVKETGCEMPLHLWNTTDTSTDYETFNRGLYALDLFVPLDALGQENAWAPSKDRGALGWWAYYLRWAVQMSGWIITAVAAAALTGVIGRKE